MKTYNFLCGAEDSDKVAVKETSKSHTKWQKQRNQYSEDLAINISHNNIIE